MNMATPDLDIIKDIPGYKVILKAVLKSQIQQLVQQLATHTDEESVILTASVADGTLSHLGSESGKGFLEDHEDIKSQFLGFCLKNHHKKKRQEKEREETEKMLHMSSETLSVSPGHYMNTFTPRGRGGSQVYPYVSMHTSPGTRHQPYPASSPRRANLNFSPNSGKAQNKLPESTSSGSIVKIEMDSENESSDQTASDSVAQGMNTSGSEVRAGVSERDNDTQSSTSTIVNEPSSEGVGFDSNSEPTTSADLNETDQDASVRVKLEESELDLEITGIEPGRASLPQNSWDPNVSMGMNFDPSDAMGSLADTTAQSNSYFRRNLQVEGKCAENKMKLNVKLDYPDLKNAYKESIYVYEYEPHMFTADEMLAKKDKRGMSTPAQACFHCRIRDTAKKIGIWDIAPTLEEISEEQKAAFFQEMFTVAPQLSERRQVVWKRLGESLQNRRKYISRMDRQRKSLIE